MDILSKTNKETIVHDEGVLDNLQPGDIILTGKDSIMARVMNTLQLDTACWGHILIAKDKTHSYEAEYHIRVINTLEALKKQEHYLVIRFKDWTDTDTHKLNEVLTPLVGKKYGYKRLILQFLDHIFCTNGFTRKFDTNPENQVCSSMVAYAFEVIRQYRFNKVYWTSCDPDDIHDDYEINPCNWVFVGSK